MGADRASTWSRWRSWRTACLRTSVTVAGDRPRASAIAWREWPESALRRMNCSRLVRVSRSSGILGFSSATSCAQGPSSSNGSGAFRQRSKRGSERQREGTGSRFDSSRPQGERHEAREGQPAQGPGTVIGARACPSLVMTPPRTQRRRSEPGTRWQKAHIEGELGSTCGLLSASRSAPSPVEGPALDARSITLFPCSPRVWSVNRSRFLRSR